ncbi:MAG: SCO family protein [Terriglobales bacterium]
MSFIDKTVISGEAKRSRGISIFPRLQWTAKLLTIVFGLSLCSFAQNMRTGLLSPPANVRPPGLKNVGIQQNLNEQIPLDLGFRDETGKTVHLSDYFGQKPVILSLVYYRCPMLCGEVLAGLSSALKVLKFNVGDEFNVLTVSFDPKDTPEIGAAKKAEYMERYGRPGAAQGWHFLTGPQSSIDALTKAAGFQYQYDPATGQFAHSTAIMILTPQGKIAQYYYGVEYAPKDLRLGLIQASQNKIGTVVDEVLLYCYHYDPNTGRYGAVISRILKLGALATLLILGLLMAVLFRHGSDAEHRAATQVSRHG